MQLVLGQTYRFTFDDPFAVLGYDAEANPTGGYYAAVELLTYERVLERDMDLMELLFTPAGLTQTDLDAAVANGTYIGKTFVHLKSVVDNASRCVPVDSIVGVPIIDVHNYAKLVLTLDLGVFADENTLDEITTMVQGFLLWKYGIASTENMVRVLAYARQWMTGAEYQATVDAREAVKIAERANVPTDLAALGISDQSQHLISAMQKLAANAATADAKNDALEALVRQLSA